MKGSPSEDVFEECASGSDSEEEIPEEAHGSKDAVPGAASSSSAAAAAAAGLHTQGGGAVVRRSNHRHTGSFKGDASLEEEQMTDGQVEQLRLQLEEQMQTSESADAPEESDTSGGDTGGFKFDSPEHKEQLKRQRAELWQWLKHVGSNMFKQGINLTKISLPVCLFEPRSFLERVTQNWEYQELLIAAAACTDPADRLRYVVAFACSGLCRQISFHKPFNPILGETYQAKYANGVEVYCEQISHHPPVSSWQVYEPSGKFVFYGNGNWVAGIKGNSVKGRQTGTNCIHFASDGANVSYELPGLQVKGVLWGERVLKYGGEMVFKDDKNGLTCELTIDAQAPPKSFLSGWFGRSKSSSLPPVKPDMIKGTLKQGDTVLDSCSGNWLTHFEWEKGLGAAAAPVSGGIKAGKTSSLRLWDIRTSPLSPAVALPAALPSDCRHRQDLIHLKAGDQAASQEWKLKLEEAQRADRKLRKEGGGFAEH